MNDHPTQPAALGCWIAELVASQQPLGRELKILLHEAAWDLYVRSAQPHTPQLPAGKPPGYDRPDTIT